MLWTALLLVFLLAFYKKDKIVDTLLIGANLIFFISTLFKFILFCCARKSEKPQIIKRDYDIANVPFYSIIMPLYKEDH
jgi:cellulose synthase/poly-beta-1,6-N-acetylglucosamine synthase-like glycosyltransferase